MHACSTIALFLVTRHVSRFEHEKLCGSLPVYVIVRLDGQNAEYASVKFGLKMLLHFYF